MHFIVDAEPAARQAGAARPLAQRVVLEEDRVVLLQHLGGLSLRDADGGAAVGEAVVLGAPAVPAAREDVHDVVPLLQRIEAAQGQVAAGAGGGGGQIVGDRARPRGGDALRDSRAGPRGAAPDGPRVARGEERPGRGGGLGWAERAGGVARGWGEVACLTRR